jgi:hypothetical protein
LPGSRLFNPACAVTLQKIFRRWAVPGMQRFPRIGRSFFPNAISRLLSSVNGEA